MFNDTLLNNITLYQNYEKDSIRAVLNSLGLQTFLKKHNLEDIYQDTKDNLSGGEKQKISLARILLEKKGFILLDEATSAIDIESSFVIEKTLLSNPEITLINIEHKILDNLLDMYDYIYEIRDMKLICRKGGAVHFD
ncbi:MAG: ATP-binding cassette domain-containing protein [Catenibacillus sp.]|nr:ATP-binding cassette domain-containing protein [Catenibacillus sp.]